MNHVQKITQTSNFFQFGPVLFKCNLEKNFIKQLNSRGKNATIDCRKNLAGHIDQELKFSENDMRWFLDETKSIFTSYIDSVLKFSFSKNEFSKTNGYHLANLWINFMRKGEFNPLHDHLGDISFVIYLSVPDPIKTENTSFVGNGNGPGSISFFYGEKSKYYKSSYYFLPKTGDMFIFPATLRHFVPPFKSDVIRTSVSGNIYLKK